MRLRLPWVLSQDVAEITESERCRAIAGHAWNYLELRDPIAVASWIAGAREEIVDSRARLAVADARGDAALVRASAAEALAFRAQSMYDELLDNYHALAMRPLTQPVLTTPSQVVPLEPREPKEPSEITRVIREQCETADGHTDHALARHLRLYARQLKVDGKSEDEIVGALVAWQSSEPAAHIAEAAG